MKENTNYDESHWLTVFRDQTMGLRKVGNLWVVNLRKSSAIPFWLTSDQTQICRKLRMRLWRGTTPEFNASCELLVEGTWQLENLENKPTLLWTGEFWGNYPREEFIGIDFSAKEIQETLANVERKLREFEEDYVCSVAVSHDKSHIWWTYKTPLISDEYGAAATNNFSETLTSNWFGRGVSNELFNWCEILSQLLPYRMHASNSESQTATQNSDSTDAELGEKYLQAALDYDFGRNGKQKNAKEAVKYYIKCLEIMESGLAYFNLALSYLKGDGVEVDKRHGYKLMWKAHHAGFPNASFYLASCFEKGKDCTVDVTKAAELYRAAAQKGHLEATFKLGLLTKEGNGVDKNPSEAFRLFGIAAKGDEKSVKPEWLYEYAHCFFEGFGTEKDPAAGVDMMRRAAEAGNADAQYTMANAYEFGLGVPKNESEHKHWLAEAAGNGHMFAQFERGEDLAESDPELAIYFFRAAASHGHALAEIRLHELKTEVENAKVDSLITQAEQGNRHAQFEVGMRYLQGKGVPQNSRRGFDWLSEAAEHGNMDALAELGWCYLEGVGVPRPNAWRAFTCFEEAAGPIKSSTNRRALQGLYHCFSKGVGTRRDRDLADKIKYKLDLNALSGGRIW